MFRAEFSYLEITIPSVARKVRWVQYPPKKPNRNYNIEFPNTLTQIVESRDVADEIISSFQTLGYYENPIFLQRKNGWFNHMAASGIADYVRSSPQYQPKWHVTFQAQQISKLFVWSILCAKNPVYKKQILNQSLLIYPNKN